MIKIYCVSKNYIINQQKYSLSKYYIINQQRYSLITYYYYHIRQFFREAFKERHLWQLTMYFIVNKIILTFFIFLQKYNSS